jgi:YggT family protein
MWPMGVILEGVGRVLDMALEIYMWVVIVRAILSWVQPDPYNPIVRFIYGLVDPVTYRLSRIVPTRIGMVDISAMVLILAIYLMRLVVVRMVIEAGLRMR